MVVNMAELLQETVTDDNQILSHAHIKQVELHIVKSEKPQSTDSPLGNTKPKGDVKLVVFDFDGTITTRDTFAMFLRYYSGTLKWALNICLLLPVFLAYGLKIIDRNTVKAKVINRFFKNQNESLVNARAENFAKTVIPKLIRPAAEKKLQSHITGQKQGLYTLYICSASIGPYLRAYFEPKGIHNILATELQSKNGVCTGQIDGFNVWGDGKMRRILAEYPSNTVKIIEAYGDSRGDREMIDAAQASFWRPFRL